MREIDDNIGAGMSDVSTRGGDWMQTYTGRAFWPLDPRAEEIDPVDIAHSLSLLCRYGGHVKQFYSVAEHCVLMSHAVSPENALWALLHDATEAYVGDMVRPLKRQIPQYAQIEAGVMFAVLERFEVPRDDIWSVSAPDEVKRADDRILLTERATLLNPSQEPWNAALEALGPLPVEIQGWSPPEAKQAYLERLKELTPHA